MMRVLNSRNAIPILELAGANIDERDNQGKTALHHALDLYPHAACIQAVTLLVNAGANVNVPCDLKGNIPLHAAACIDLQDLQYELNLQKAKMRFSTPFVNEI
jgi:hypothetical protein